MIGFDYRSIVLQVIHGSLIVLTIVFLYGNCFMPQIGFLTDKEFLAPILLLFISYAAGIILDFIADIMESCVIKHIINLPYYHLLTRDRWSGISLAHRHHIRNELCKVAAHFKSTEPAQREECRELYMNLFETEKPDKKDLNYLLQVAKNFAFKECQVYQKEQINSFFMLYIFTRNLSFGLLLASILFMSNCHFITAAILFSLCLFSIIASYRYYLYYARILLGTTMRIDKITSPARTPENSEQQ